MDVRKFAVNIINKRITEKTEIIKKKDDVLNQTEDRVLEPKLEKWRLKERKYEFSERI